MSGDRLPIKMLHDRVLVREPHDEGERRSSGGILIPATAQVSKRLVWGEVLAVGNHVRAVETGDRVLFSPDDRFEVEISGAGVHAAARARPACRGRAAKRRQHRPLPLGQRPLHRPGLRR